MPELSLSLSMSMPYASQIPYRLLREMEVIDVKLLTHPTQWNKRGSPDIESSKSDSPYLPSESHRRLLESDSDSNDRLPPSSSVDEMDQGLPVRVISCVALTGAIVALTWSRRKSRRSDCEQLQSPQKMVVMRPLVVRDVLREASNQDIDEC
jgi:hypothetical protein